MGDRMEMLGDRVEMLGTGWRCWESWKAPVGKSVEAVLPPTCAAKRQRAASLSAKDTQQAADAALGSIL